MDFDSLTSPRLARALAENNFTVPTEIQSKAIPVIRQHRDLAASSPTGTGKTLAYLLPVFEGLSPGIKSPQAVILAPTRELAAQIYKGARFLTDGDSKIALLVGGTSIKRQIDKLKEKPAVIIGSAGRILELARLKKISMHNVKTIVVDEADRLLDDVNRNEVAALIKRTLAHRQLLFFSASINAQTLEHIRAIAKNPVVIDSGGKLPDSIEHIFFVCQPRDKIAVLRKLVHGAEISRAIVFLNNPNSIDNMAKRLNFHGIPAAPLYGGGDKEARKQVLRDFTEGRAVLLIASDIAARGLDIEGISHIINLDVPEDALLYQHRAGRVGRMGASGTAVTIAAPHELKHLRNCEKRLSFKASRKEMRFGKITGVQRG